MAIGLEFLTSNASTAYPFAENAPGLIHTDGTDFVWPATHPGHGTAAWLPTNALLDAAFVTPENVTEVYLAGFEVETFGPSKYVRWVFRDQNDVRIRTAPHFLHNYPDPGDGWAVITMRENDWIIRLVYTAQLLYFLDTYVLVGGTMEFGATGTDLPFETCTVQIRPARLQSVQLYDSTGPISDQLNGALQLIAGYNVTADVVESDDADTTAVTLSAVAGTGQGVTPCEVHLGDDPPPERIMTLMPDSAGGVRIAGDDCYEIVPIPDLDTLQITGSCYACCTCDDYVAVAEAIEALIARTDVVRLDLSDTHAEYSDALTHFEVTHIPTLRKVYTETVAVAGTQLINSELVPGKHGHYTITVTNRGTETALLTSVVLNPTDCRILGGTLITSVGSGQTPSTIAGAPGQVQIFTGDIEPGDWVEAVIRVLDLNGLTAATIEWTTTWTMYGTTSVETEEVGFA